MGAEYSFAGGVDNRQAVPYVGQVNTERTPLTPERIRAALVVSGGSVTRAAKSLGYSRQTIHEWMRVHGITVERVVKDAA